MSRLVLGRWGDESRRWVLLVLALTALTLSACGEPTVPTTHLILISVDTLRADHLGCYGDERNLTPNIDRLAGESELFMSAYAVAPFTLPSVASLMTGLYPEEIGMTSNTTRLSGDIPTLSTRLRREGWKTGAVVSNFVLRKACGLDAGFDYFDARFPQQEKTRKVPERIAASTTDAALEMLGKLTAEPKRPIFLWVHYQDPHGPYTPPGERVSQYLEQERSRAGGKKQLRVRQDPSGVRGIPSYQYLPPHREVAYYRAAYSAEINYTDEQVGRLLKALDDRGILSSAVVIFVADHGEGLGENDYWFAHGEHLNEAAVRVPLLIRVPNRPSRVRTDVVSLLDVPPTVAAIVGLDLEDEFEGRDLLAEGAEREIAGVFFSTRMPAWTWSRIGMLRFPYKFVRTTIGDRVKEQLYQLPDESTDLSATLTDTARSMSDELDSTYVMREVSATSSPRTLSAEERDALRALGYVDP